MAPPSPAARPGSAAQPAVILIVDDEPDVVDLVRYRLRGAGHTVLVAEDGLQALRTAREQRPDLIVLDLMLPEMSGEEVCRQLRADRETAAIPIPMRTAKGEGADRIAGLEIGADDYVGKPFSPRELILRVEALLRRVRAVEERRETVVEVDDFRINKGDFEITLEGRKLDLTTTEFKLLCLLIERRGKVLSREALLQDVWNYTAAIDTRTVDTHVRRLREKLGPGHAPRIETVRGEGYRFTTTPS